MKNQELFKRFMAGLGETFDKNISETLSDIYWHALKNHSDEQCKDAFNQVFLKFKFFPKPAEIIELINGKNIKIEDKALVTANRIIAHLEQYGARVFPNLDDDPVAKYLMTTRWNYYEWASQILTSELKWWVKEFCELYRAYSESSLPLEIEMDAKVVPLVKNIGQRIN